MIFLKKKCLPVEQISETSANIFFAFGIRLFSSSFVDIPLHSTKRIFILLTSKIGEYFPYEFFCKVNTLLTYMSSKLIFQILHSIKSNAFEFNFMTVIFPSSLHIEFEI